MGTGSSKQAKETNTQKTILTKFQPLGIVESESVFTGGVPTAPKVRSRPFPGGVAARIAGKGVLPVKPAPPNFVSF
jgi:hypothetical protein